MASYKKALCSLLLLSLLFISIRAQHPGDEHACKHDEIEQNPQFADIEEDVSSLKEGRGLGTYSNIRIYPYYEFMKSSAPSSYASYVINKLVPPAIDYFQAALKIKYPVSGKLVLGSGVNSICERSTPSILKSGGVSADVFIYYDSEAVSGTQIANSKYCFLASGTKRPLVVRTMINRNMLPVTSDVLIHEKNMYTIMHELMHTLGFSTSLYGYFIDDNARTRTGHIKSVSIAGNTRKVIDVPPLTEKLRTFYGCSSLQGAVMENGGGSGTSASHFERKFFVYEAMASGSILGRRISQFSLAMLEGSGWYVPDYSYAEPFFYGQGQGCTFVTGTCSSSSSKFDEFCTGSSRACAPHGRGGGYCSSDSIMDGCKYYYPHEDYDCENDNGGDYARLPSVETYGRGAGSKCFTGTLNTRSSSSATSFCFKYTCIGSGSSSEVEVQVGSNKVTCTQEGTKTIDGYYGSINCPDPETFCDTVGKKYCPKNCMGRGSCVNGHCQCNSGYTGIDCALSN